MQSRSVMAVGRMRSPTDWQKVKTTRMCRKLQCKVTVPRPRPPTLVRASEQLTLTSASVQWSTTIAHLYRPCPCSITSSAATRPARRIPRHRRRHRSRCRTAAGAIEILLLGLCRDECHKAIPVRHTYLWQRLGTH
jgi:hypothetical protein